MLLAEGFWVLHFDSDISVGFASPGASFLKCGLCRAKSRPRIPVHSSQRHRGHGASCSTGTAFLFGASLDSPNVCALASTSAVQFLRARNFGPPGCCMHLSAAPPRWGACATEGPRQFVLGVTSGQHRGARPGSVRARAPARHRRHPVRGLRAVAGRTLDGAPAARLASQRRCLRKLETLDSTHSRTLPLLVGSVGSWRPTCTAAGSVNEIRGHSFGSCTLALERSRGESTESVFEFITTHETTRRHTVQVRSMAATDGLSLWTSENRRLSESILGHELLLPTFASCQLAARLHTG